MASEDVKFKVQRFTVQDSKEFRDSGIKEWILILCFNILTGFTGFSFKLAFNTNYFLMEVG
jgi:hypothetical protein